MPTLLTDPTPLLIEPVQPPRKRWTRTECAALDAAGVLANQKLELIDGELINKMGKNRPHTNTLVVVLGWLIRVFGEKFINPETSIDVAPEDNPTNEPQPDLIVLARPSRTFDANPGPEDIRLAVEISDTTVSFDLSKKAPLYARAGIADYWVFDVKKRRLIVHRDPQNGKYQSVIAYSENESVAPLAASANEFRVSEAFTE
jgi:Uma2 family endonuclease